MEKTQEKYSQDYKLLINDLVKISTVFIVSNILMFISDSSNNKLFGTSYIKLMFVVLLGFITYWLVIKNLINV